MTHVVTLPDGSTHNFPDEATPQMIAQALGVKFSPTPQQQAMGSTAGGVVSGMLEPVMGIGQLAPRAVSEVATLGGYLPPNAVSRAADASAARVDKGASQLINTRADARQMTGQTGFDWPQLAGNIISPANLVVGEGAGLLPDAAGLGGRVLQGAGVGAAYGATAPVDTSKGDYGTQKVGQVATGAALGGAAPVAGNIAGKAVYPIAGDAQKLLQGEGIRLTPGQSMGGAVQSIENKATSVPLLGDAIKATYARGYEDFNRAVANRALAPIGKELPMNVPVGNALVSHVESALGDEYNRILPQMKGNMDAQLQNEMATAQGVAGTLPEPRYKQMQSILSNILDKKVMPNGDITGNDTKDILTALGQQAAKYSKSPDPDHQDMAQIFYGLKNSFSQMLQRNNSPQLAQQLRNADEGWANFIRLQRASTSTEAQGTGGRITPAQLLNAVKATDPSLRKGAFARGDALMQDLATAGQKVLPDKVPDSGTAGRSIVGALGLLGTGALSPLAAGLGAGATAAYTRPGQAILRGMAARPQFAEPAAGVIANYSNPAALLKALTGR